MKYIIKNCEKSPHHLIRKSDSCINNVKLTLNCTKDHDRSNASCHSTYNPTTQPKKLKSKLRASLENVSINPWGVDLEDQYSLRRSRSLAISRENLFPTLEYSEDGRGGRRRSQLIPRAKLIDRSSIRENRYKGSSVENLHNPERHRSRRHSTLIPRTTHLLNPFNDTDETARKNTRYIPTYPFKTFRKPRDSRTVSIPTTRQRRNSLSKISYEELPELSLPNYYPDARYDTDNTDNISLTDNISSVSFENSSKTKYPLDLKWDKSEPNASIPYDENIVLSANKTLYEKAKPRTIRNPTPYHENYGKINLSASRTTEEAAEEKPTEETDTNLDEINLNNEHYTTPQRDHYSESEQSDCNTEKTCDKSSAKEKPNKAENISNNPDITLIEVPAGTQEAEQHKTVVSVKTAAEKQENIEEEKDNCKQVRESKSHSHNYLKEFLETQKGSRKPLQNFLAKKFSNLSRKTTKETTNLKDNKFHSLPDITASKNLRKCEKIDRKLRKCQQSNQHTRSQQTSKENRFIVNIGRHFDVTAGNAAPVDFEVKISKVARGSNRNIRELKSEEEFIAAVKSLKETLHGSQIKLDENDNITKPAVVSLTTKLEGEQNENEKYQKDMALLYCRDECSKEFQEKLGTMRNYWNRMVGSDTNEHKVQKLEETEVKTSVEEVKKIFEQPEEKVEEKPQSKVQLTKQLFEPKATMEKTGKISPIIKETCSYFENTSSSHFFENDRSFESLCPTSVEIINTKNNATKKDLDQPKPHKAVTKSNSICTKPEFDHVRYKLVKSDLFQKKIFAPDKESQFDGLIQYLQDYSFQELLIDNNIVIIEPIRSKVPYEPSSCLKSMKNVTTMIHKNQSADSDNKSTLNRHFFYHPIRVNKEVNEDELPNPDTVRQVREFFEGGVKKSETIQESEQTTKENICCSSDPDKDRCSATDSNSHLSNMSDFGSQENLYDSIDNEIYCEYVSEDILEKIREYGTSVTYYGGRVVDQKSGQPVLTKAIMNEIRNNENKCVDCSNCKNNEVEKNDKEKDHKEGYHGMKFRILKSNSCSSRLELVGTESMQDTKKQLLSQVMKKKNLRKRGSIINEINTENEKEQEDKFSEKNAINECIKKQAIKDNENQPKIIGEEMKIPENKTTKWREVSSDKKSSNATYNDNGSQKIYDFYHYDNVKSRPKKVDDMEFEPYEVA
ncbi:LOW QUALITY PROTEIN: javelin [Leptinotarsa decemlineata]|uniref:LOW QUALITY PROTEIN: javelin n=1 Tax=Leptinotarsa decemlineata TaxID=7539 RepID=UPI003D307CB9